MNDPYAVLGVSPDCSDAELKKAYHELVRKYHPDNYHDNPLADLAEEKMKTINEAYDTAQKLRQSGASGHAGASYGQSASHSSYNTYTDTNAGMYAAIRSAIAAGDLERAEAMLDSMADRGAQWNYLMGMIYYKRGWLDEAAGLFQTAYTMEPGNPEYVQAYNSVNRAGYPYRYTRSAPVAGGGDMCSICTAVMCANMLCRPC